MNSEYPRVLIFGQPFNNYSGGGITLTNLFKGWPKDKIAVAYLGHGLSNITTDICDIYYQLGKEEHKWRFPFNLFQKSFPSGLKSFEHKQGIQIRRSNSGVRNKIVNRLFYPLLRWLGLFHSMSQISLSQKFRNWLSEFKPEVLYLQVASRETTLFASELVDYLGIPSANHAMDDWPSSIRTHGLFKTYWYRKIDAELKKFINKADLNFSISEAMSDEYFKRYGRRFIPFHNPVDSNIWLPYVKKNYSLDNGKVTILYSGRIGIGITESILDVASAIEAKNNEQVSIQLHIQTFTKDPAILNKLRKFRCVVINPFTAYEQLPGIFSAADILLLANEFNLKGLVYLKYSMPTKASEYMISGTPVLLYAPKQAAISEFFMKNHCGCCVTERSSAALANALDSLINNENYRRELGQNAVALAMDKFDQHKVRNEFQRFLIDLSHN